MSNNNAEKKNLFANLKDKLTETENPVVQTQVQPIKQKKAKEPEQLFSFHIQSEKLTALKMKAVADNTTVKELINNALINYYNI